MDKRTKGLVVVGVLVIIAMIAVIIGIVGRKVINIAGGGNGGSSRSDMTLDELYADLDVNEATPVKGTVTLDSPDLYAELPEIDKYPLAVEGNGDIDIEIFTSGEKAGKDMAYRCCKFLQRFWCEDSGRQVGIDEREISAIRYSR